MSVNIPVAVRTDDSPRADGCMKNLSLSGALVKVTLDLGLHALIEVKIHIPSPSPRTEAVAAYVSRTLDDGVGVEWCVYAPNVIKDLLRSSSPASPR